MNKNVKRIEKEREISNIKYLHEQDSVKDLHQSEIIHKKYEKNDEIEGEWRNIESIMKVASLENMK